jgi:hypothetical protein
MSDNYRTDEWLAEIFAGWHDPCPYNGLEEGKDGLLEDWKIKTYVNPPYSNPKPWIRKAIHDNRKYGSTIVLLLKMDTSTQWFTELFESGAHFLWINRRLKYKSGKAAPFPSMLAVLPSLRLPDLNEQVRLDYAATL